MSLMIVFLLLASYRIGFLFWFVNHPQDDFLEKRGEFRVNPRDEFTSKSRSVAIGMGVFAFFTPYGAVQILAFGCRNLHRMKKLW